MAKHHKKFFHTSSQKQLRRFTRSRAGNVFYFLFLFAAGIFSVLPFVYSISTSLKPLDELLIFPPTLIRVKRPTFNNYLSVPHLLSSLSVPVTRYVFNSVFIAAVGTALAVLLSAMAAFVFSKSDLKFKNQIFLIIQLSLLFNAYTLAIPQYVIYAKFGIIDTYLSYIVPAGASSMGVFLMKQYIDGYGPDALIEAAKIDGADWFKIFGRIILPIVRPCVLTLVLFTFLGLWNTGSAGTIFTETLKTLPTVLSTISSGGLARAGSASAASVIMLIPPVLVYLISQSSIKETMSNAGIK